MGGAMVEKHLEIAPKTVPLPLFVVMRHATVMKTAPYVKQIVVLAQEKKQIHQQMAIHYFTFPIQPLNG
jgi:hypothetical protein